MKKTMIIALLAVLVLGAFTACNGDVNAELAGSRTITLEIPEEVWAANYTFVGSGSKTMDVEVPSDCDTWAQLLAKVTDISIIKNDSTVRTLKVYDNGKIYFFYNDIPWFGLIRDVSKSILPDTTTTATEKIVLGGTYVLTVASN